MTPKPTDGYLRILEGKQKGQAFRLNQQTVSIGRDPNNSIPVRDIEVSRLHAQILHKDDTFKLIDLNSSNGVYVNDHKIRELKLDDGDQIRLGKTVFVFEVKDENIDGSTDVIDLSGKKSPKAKSTLIPLEKRLDVFCDISNAISQTRDLQELLNKILQIVFDWTDADRGCILLENENQNGFSVIASRDRDGGKHKAIKISKSILDHARKTEDTVVIDSHSQDSEISASKSMRSMGVREAICVPIKFRKRLLGFLYVDSVEGSRPAMADQTFRSEHVKLMSAIGQQTAVAVENHSYYAQLLETNKQTAVGESMTSLSHHIKNILQGINGGAHILDDGLETESAELINQGWQIVKRNQQKINQLVLDMLSFGKAPDLKLRLIDLNALVGGVVKSFGPDLADSKIQILWQASPSPIELIVDRKLIFRAVQNLVQNAVDACAGNESGVIKIAVDRLAEQGQIAISVKDNGCGIAEDNLENIFSIFESSKGDRATGIGLPVAQRFARQHNGDVHVTSTFGEGSEFSLVLPFVEHDEPITLMAPRMFESSRTKEVGWDD